MWLWHLRDACLFIDVQYVCGVTPQPRAHNITITPTKTFAHYQIVETLPGPRIFTPSIAIAIALSIFLTYLETLKNLREKKLKIHCDIFYPPTSWSCSDKDDFWIFDGTLSKLRLITKFLDVKTGFQLFCVVSKNISKFTFNQSKWRRMTHLSMCLQSHWRLHLIFQCVYKNIECSSHFPNALCTSKASTYILSF